MSGNMRKQSRRQFQTPSSNFSTDNKSKLNNDRNGVVDGSKPSTTPAAITTKNLARPSMRNRLPPPVPPPPPSKYTGPVSNNLILAGYLAEEFITKGTLFGEAWESDRSEEGSRTGEKRKSSEDGEEIEKQQRYIEVADILKAEATHLPGIFNPTQLAHLLHME